MTETAISVEALQRAAEQSAKASAGLEGRVVPTGFVRSEAVDRLLMELADQR